MTSASTSAQPSPSSGPVKKSSKEHISAAANAYNNTERKQAVYLRVVERQCERSKFTTLYHCLEPVKLVNKAKIIAKTGALPQTKGNLHPLFKASEDWIAPSVGLPLENRPGYRCMLYIVDGTLFYDNGLGTEKLLSKGMVLMTTTSQKILTYVRNPSKTHRVHIVRLWFDMDDYSPPTSANSINKKPACNHHEGKQHNAAGITVETTKKQHQQKQSQQKEDGKDSSDKNNNNSVIHADFHCKIRHVADSDKENYLLVLTQPSNYRPSFGMTSFIYGAMKPPTRKKDADGASEAGAKNGEYGEAEAQDDMTSFDRSYYLPKTARVKRPEYFTPESIADMSQSLGELTGEWAETDPQLTSRVCVDPFVVDEDIFVSLCNLEPGAKVIYEPYDLHDKRRAREHRHQNPQRGTRRRLWIQSLLDDVNPDASANGGRLVINGDKVNRMRPGDSVYIRRVELTDSIALENCGRTPIEFIVAETPY
ncbi:hypothetical protein LPJ72_005817 [Coemansia sp. Benny D160-2]|nr:hypothetical protein LPJ72_005817 [Coemansia sp. Benny D160-2]